MKTSDVFGINTKVNPYSYVDRGELDGELHRLAGRNTHICLKGESKSGKSWLRQKSFPDAIVVQCRIEFTATDIYISILSQLGIEVVTNLNSTGAKKFALSGSAEAGWKLLAKAQAKEHLINAVGYTAIAA